MNINDINRTATAIIEGHALPFNCPLPRIRAAVMTYCDNPAMPDITRRRIINRIDLTLN